MTTMMNKPISLSYPVTRVEDGSITADALISIRASVQNAHRFPEPIIHPSYQDKPILILRFDDIPVESFQRKDITWIGPTKNDVLMALDFARHILAADRNTFIAVHCEKGKSRSAAIALAITADYLGAGNEGDAVRMLLEDDQEEMRCFNPGIIKMADEILDRDGAIERALMSQCKPFKSWLKYWERNLGYDL